MKLLILILGLCLLAVLCWPLAILALGPVSTHLAPHASPAPDRDGGRRRIRPGPGSPVFARAAARRAQITGFAGGNGRIKGLGCFAHHIVSSKRIRDTNSTLGIIAPFSIDNKPVTVLAWRQIHRGAPDSIGAFLHSNRLLLPMRKVADEHHAHRTGRGKPECLLLGTLRLFTHNLLLSDQTEFAPPGAESPSGVFTLPGPTRNPKSYLPISALFRLPRSEIRPGKNDVNNL